MGAPDSIYSLIYPKTQLKLLRPLDYSPRGTLVRHREETATLDGQAEAQTAKLQAFIAAPTLRAESTL